VCILTGTEVKPGKTPYIEQDSVPGLSGNDQFLQIGDKVDPGQIVQVDECNVWYVIKRNQVFFTSSVLATCVPGKLQLYHPYVTFMLLF